MTAARGAVRKIGLQLIEEKRNEVLAEMRSAGHAQAIDGDKTVLGRDLLSVLSTFPSSLSVIKYDADGGPSPLQYREFPSSADEHPGNSKPDINLHSSRVRNDLNSVIMDVILLGSISPISNQITRGSAFYTYPPR